MSRHSLELVRGLEEIGGSQKRFVLTLLAAQAQTYGKGRFREATLRDEAEMGSDALGRVLCELEKEGWILVRGSFFALALNKMKRSQRVDSRVASALSEVSR